MLCQEKNETLLRNKPRVEISTDGKLASEEQQPEEPRVKSSQHGNKSHDINYDFPIDEQILTPQYRYNILGSVFQAKLESLKGLEFFHLIFGQMSSNYYLYRQIKENSLETEYFDKITQLANTVFQEYKRLNSRIAKKVKTLAMEIAKSVDSRNKRNLGKTLIPKEIYSNWAEKQLERILENADDIQLKRAEKVELKIKKKTELYIDELKEALLRYSGVLGGYTEGTCSIRAAGVTRVDESETPQKKQTTVAVEIDCLEKA